MEKNCVFCKIAKGEIPANRVYEDNLVVAFNDIKPVAPIHILVVPKKHLTNLAEVNTGDEKVLGHIQKVISDLAKEFKIEKAFRTMNANGNFAGQTVMHLHYHLVGGWREKATEEDLIKESTLDRLSK